MYLLQLQSDGELSLDVFYGKQVPQYAILSHTWIANHEEVTFKDIMKGKGTGKAGYQKLRFIAMQAAMDGLKYFWVDTCCIDKASSAELQEAINSMFQWYQKSSKCYVYLADVSWEISSNTTIEQSSSPHRPWHEAFLRSRWFTRGWTLQELLAPQSVQFFSKEGTLLGDKRSLESSIRQVTKIPLDILKGSYTYLLQYDVDERLSWASERHTTREEDAAYSLLGLFDLHMPLLYGEGRFKAFMRLHRERESVQLYEKSHIPSHFEIGSSNAAGRPHDPSMSAGAGHPPSKRTADEAFQDASVETARKIPPSFTHTASVSGTMDSQQPTEDMKGFEWSDQVTHADTQSPPTADDDNPDLSETNFTSIRDANVNADDDSANKSMEFWWNDSITRHFNRPDGYARVAVLFIRWLDDLDDEMRIHTELHELDLLFRDRFRFHTATVELKTKTRPQNQLSASVSDFVRDHDGPHNLLIVHYIGHAIFRDLENYLQLTANVHPEVRVAGNHAAVANWNKAEEMLRSDEVESDVLTILDTSNAANLTQRRLTAPDPVLDHRPAPSLVKDDQPKLFELITNAMDETPTSSEPFSLTKALTEALINHLAEDTDRPISTFRLIQRINLDPRRRDNPAHLWSRMSSISQHIFLRPIISDPARRYEMSGTRARGILSLDFELRDPSLNQEQIEILTKSLTKAFRGKPMLGVRKIKWRNMSSRPPVSSFERVALVMYVITTWKAFVARQRQRRGASDVLD